MSLDWFIVLIVVAIAVLIFMRKSQRGFGSPKFFAPDFEARPLMNKPERFLFNQLRKGFPNHWHVMSQVSYGAFLACDSRNKYMSINSKRANFIVLYPSLDVAAVFEYHGRGHYGFSDEGKTRAQTSDEVKRRACAEAAIHFIELPAYVDTEELRVIIRDIVSPPKPDSDE